MIGNHWIRAKKVDSVIIVLFYVIYYAGFVAEYSAVMLQKGLLVAKKLKNDFDIFSFVLACLCFWENIFLQQAPYRLKVGDSVVVLCFSS